MKRPATFLSEPRGVSHWLDWRPDCWSLPRADGDRHECARAQPSNWRRPRPRPAAACFDAARTESWKWRPTAARLPPQPNDIVLPEPLAIELPAGAARIGARRQLAQGAAAGGAQRQPAGDARSQGADRRRRASRDLDGVGRGARRQPVPASEDGGPVRPAGWPGAGRGVGIDACDRWQYVHQDRPGRSRARPHGMARCPPRRRPAARPLPARHDGAADRGGDVGDRADPGQ